jgi:hypothetical protein
LDLGGQEMTKEKMADDITLYTIALVKSYAYCEEYDSTSGKVNERHGSALLKAGYIDGFLAGFAHKLTGEK